MLDRPRHSQPTAGGSCAKQAPGIPAVWSPAPARLAAWNVNAQHAGEKIAQSWLAFVGDRLAKDVAFPERLSACRTFNDVCVAYMEFWQQAYRDYAGEFTEIADATWSAMQSPFPATDSQSNECACAR